MIERILITLMEAVKWLVLIRMLISMINQGAKPVLAEQLERVTEPMLRPLRSLIPPVALGGIYLDLSPLILFFLINLLEAFVRRIF